jgi:anti-sigma-K factor RskA
MVRQLKHEEIAELLGAYALDAVDADEAQIIDAHLTVCPRCRAEVRDHREVASLLAYTGEAAPPGLWDKLAAALDDPAPAVEAPVLAPVVRPASWARRGGASVLLRAAAVLVVLGALAGLWLKIDNVKPTVDANGSGALGNAALAASSAPGSRKVRLATSDNQVLADAVVTADGSSYLWNLHLPPLPSDRAYQLWAIVGEGQKRSVGVLGNTPRIAAFNVPTASVVALAITEEVAVGADAPSRQAVAFGLMPA